MTQTTQDKRGVWLTNADDPIWDSAYPAGNRPTGDMATPYVHGSPFRITANSTAKTFTSTFLGGSGGAIESLSVGATPANASNWVFDQPNGVAATVYNDTARGKVLYADQSATNALDSAIRYDYAGRVLANSCLYFSYWVKRKVTLFGVPYTYDFQTKQFRLNYENDIQDNTILDFKWHFWKNSGNAIYVNSNGGGSISYAGTVPSNLETWELMECFFYTGANNVADAQFITRVHNSSGTTMASKKQNFLFYSNGNKINWLIDQNYFGNFNQLTQTAIITFSTVADNTTYGVTRTGGTSTINSGVGATVASVIAALVVKLTTDYPTWTITSDATTITMELLPHDYTTNYYFTGIGCSANNVVTQLPKPDVRQTWRDDHYTSWSTDGYYRTELRDNLDEALCTIRETQGTLLWSATEVRGNINMGGIPAGLRQLYLVALSGVDYTTGKDVVDRYRQVWVA